MKIHVGLIGSGGLIGQALIKNLGEDYVVTTIKSTCLYKESSELASYLASLDVIINLAGYPINGRWNKKHKNLIYNSRVLTTRNLINAFRLLKDRPVHLINASAIGIYKDFIISTEKADIYAGNFLSKLVQDWENEATKIRELNVGLSLLRFGVVLSREGGAFKTLRWLFKLGIGGKMGNGKQGFSFILIDDVVRIFDLVMKEKMFGIINVVAPEPVTNELFTKELSRVLKRPAFFMVPEFMLKLFFREGACLLLEGQKVFPERLLKEGFTFIGSDLISCLRKLEK